MNEKNEKAALTSADTLLLDLLTKQPEMIKVSSANAESGKAVGEFIAALRSQLISMYQKTH